MIEVPSAKKIALSTNLAVPPVYEMLDEAECDSRSISPSLSSVIMREEGEG